MNAAARLAKAGAAFETRESLSTVDIEHLDRLAAIVRVSKERAESARAELQGMASGAAASSPALLAEAVDHLERTASNYAADAKAFFHVWEQTRGRR
jgi:hypothetical protein